jgi:hypothetical protein
MATFGGLRLAWPTAKNGSPFFQQVHAALKADRGLDVHQWVID